MSTETTSIDNIMPYGLAFSFKDRIFKVERSNGELDDGWRLDPDDTGVHKNSGWFMVWCVKDELKKQCAIAKLFEWNQLPIPVNNASELVY